MLFIKASSAISVRNRSRLTANIDRFADVVKLIVAF